MASIRPSRSFTVFTPPNTTNLAYRLDAERRLSGPKLTSLAEQMTKAENPAEAALLRAEIMRGFYGGARA